MITPSGNFGPSLQQRLTPSVERFNSVIDIVKQSLRVAVVGIVREFKPGPPPTVNVLVATTEYVIQNTSQTVLSLATKPVALPILQDVPVFIPSGGIWSFTCPIQPGDECLVIFTDTQLDVWLESGVQNNTPVNPISQRRHSLSDGIALVGLSSLPHSFTDYSTTSAQLRSDDGTVVIDLAPNQITITAPTVQVNATTANVTASGNANVQGENVKLTGTTSLTFEEGANTRDWFTHVHSILGGTTGPVF